MAVRRSRRVAPARLVRSAARRPAADAAPPSQPVLPLWLLPRPPQRPQASSPACPPQRRRPRASRSQERRAWPPLLRRQRPSQPVLPSCLLRRPRRRSQSSSHSWSPSGQRSGSQVSARAARSAAARPARQTHRHPERRCARPRLSAAHQARRPLACPLPHAGASWVRLPRQIPQSAIRNPQSAIPRPTRGHPSARRSSSRPRG